MVPYLVVMLLLFYVLPFAMRDTGSAMSILLVGIPAGCFVTALIYGIQHSFNICYVVLVALLFVPSIFMFYNYTAGFYSYVYGAITLLGNGIGAGIHYLIHRNED